MLWLQKSGFVEHYLRQNSMIVSIAILVDDANLLLGLQLFHEWDRVRKFMSGLQYQNSIEAF